MEVIGKKITVQMKDPGYNVGRRYPHDGIIESLKVKLDNPIRGYYDDLTHVTVGGPSDNYEVIKSGGKRKTRKSRKATRKAKKTRKH